MYEEYLEKYIQNLVTWSDDDAFNKLKVFAEASILEINGGGEDCEYGEYGEYDDSYSDTLDIELAELDIELAELDEEVIKEAETVAIVSDDTDF